MPGTVRQDDGAGSCRALNQLQAPQIMQMHRAQNASGLVHHHNRRDLSLLHQVQRLACQHLRPNRLWIPRHARSRGHFQRRAAMLLHQPAQIPIGDDSRQPSVGLQHRGHPEALLTHLVKDVGHRRSFAHARQRLSRVHQVLHAEQFLPSRPAGCKAAKSSWRNPRRSNNATASASPTAIATVVLAVGARFSEQASSRTLTSSATSLASPSVDATFPVSVTSGISNRFSASSRRIISSVSPPYDTASMASPRASMPKSPCSASAGCRKNDGVPVLESVAEIFRPISPDLPIPVTATRPLQAKSPSTALAKLASSRALTSCSARASISSTRRAVSKLIAGSNAEQPLLIPSTAPTIPPTPPTATRLPHRKAPPLDCRAFPGKSRRRRRPRPRAPAAQ